MKEQEQILLKQQAIATQQNEKYAKVKTEFYSIQRANILKNEQIKKTTKDNLNKQITYRKDIQNSKIDIEINKTGAKSIKTEVGGLVKTKLALKTENEKQETRIANLRLELNKK